MRFICHNRIGNISPFVSSLCSWRFIISHFVFFLFWPDSVVRQQPKLEHISGFKSWTETETLFIKSEINGPYFVHNSVDKWILQSRLNISHWYFSERRFTDVWRIQNRNQSNQVCSCVSGVWFGPCTFWGWMSCPRTRWCSRLYLTEEGRIQYFAVLLVFMLFFALIALCSLTFKLSHHLVHLVLATDQR